MHADLHAQKMPVRGRQTRSSSFADTKKKGFEKWAQLNDFTANSQRAILYPRVRIVLTVTKVPLHNGKSYLREHSSVGERFPSSP